MKPAINKDNLISTMIRKGYTPEEVKEEYKKLLRKEGALGFYKVPNLEEVWKQQEEKS